MKDDKIEIGDAIVLKFDEDRPRRYLLGTPEATKTNRISPFSPVGRLLIGRKSGEEIFARVGNTLINCQVFVVEKARSL